MPILFFAPPTLVKEGLKDAGYEYIVIDDCWSEKQRVNNRFVLDKEKFLDGIGQHEDLSDYKIVCAPEMYVTDDNVVRRLYDFAQSGGKFIITNRSGVKVGKLL